MKDIKKIFGVEIGEKFDIDDGGEDVWPWRGCYFDKSGELNIPVAPAGGARARELEERITDELLSGKCKIIKGALKPKEPEWLIRVKKEKEDLIEKVKKLQAYLDTEPEISSEAKFLLFKQETTMWEYIHILDERIKLYREENKNG